MTDDTDSQLVGPLLRTDKLLFFFFLTAASVANLKDKKNKIKKAFSRFFHDFQNMLIWPFSQNSHVVPTSRRYKRRKGKKYIYKTQNSPTKSKQTTKIYYKFC